jgi:hypothetical protein
MLSLGSFRVVFVKENTGVPPGERRSDPSPALSDACPHRAHPRASVSGRFLSHQSTPFLSPVPTRSTTHHTEKKHDVPAVRKLLEMRRRTQTHHLAPRRPNLSLSCLLLVPPLAHHGSTAATSSQELAGFFYSDTGS